MAENPYSQIVGEASDLSSLLLNGTFDSDVSYWNTIYASGLTKTWEEITPGNGCMKLSGTAGAIYVRQSTYFESNLFNRNFVKLSIRYQKAWSVSAPTTFRFTADVTVGNAVKYNVLDDIEIRDDGTDWIDVELWLPHVFLSVDLFLGVAGSGATGTVRIDHILVQDYVSDSFQNVTDLCDAFSIPEESRIDTLYYKHYMKNVDRYMGLYPGYGTMSEPQQVASLTFLRNGDLFFSTGRNDVDIGGTRELGSIWWTEPDGNPRFSYRVDMIGNATARQGQYSICNFGHAAENFTNGNMVVSTISGASIDPLHPEPEADWANSDRIALIEISPSGSIVREKKFYPQEWYRSYPRYRSVDHVKYFPAYTPDRLSEVTMSYMGRPSLSRDHDGNFLIASTKWDTDSCKKPFMMKVRETDFGLIWAKVYAALSYGTGYGPGADGTLTGMGRIFELADNGSEIRAVWAKELSPANINPPPCSYRLCFITNTNSTTGNLTRVSKIDILPIVGEPLAALIVEGARLLKNDDLLIWGFFCEDANNPSGDWRANCAGVARLNSLNEVLWARGFDYCDNNPANPKTRARFIGGAEADDNSGDIILIEGNDVDVYKLIRLPYDGDPAGVRYVKTNDRSVSTANWRFSWGSQTCLTVQGNYGAFMAGGTPRRRFCQGKHINGTDHTITAALGGSSGYTLDGTPTGWQDGTCVYYNHSNASCPMRVEDPATHVISDLPKGFYWVVNCVGNVFQLSATYSPLTPLLVLPPTGVYPGGCMNDAYTHEFQYMDGGVCTYIVKFDADTGEIGPCITDGWIDTTITERVPCPFTISMAHDNSCSSPDWDRATGDLTPGSAKILTSYDIKTRDADGHEMYSYNYSNLNFTSYYAQPANVCDYSAVKPLVTHHSSNFALDSDGNIYVYGVVRSKNTTPNYSMDAILMKISKTTGQAVWKKLLRHTGTAWKGDDIKDPSWEHSGNYWTACTGRLVVSGSDLILFLTQRVSGLYQTAALAFKRSDGSYRGSDPCRNWSINSGGSDDEESPASVHLNYTVGLSSGEFLNIGKSYLLKSLGTYTPQITVLKTTSSFLSPEMTLVRPETSLVDDSVLAGEMRVLCAREIAANQVRVVCSVPSDMEGSRLYVFDIDSSTDPMGLSNGYWWDADLDSDKMVITGASIGSDGRILAVGSNFYGTYTGSIILGIEPGLTAQMTKRLGGTFANASLTSVSIVDGEDAFYIGGNDMNEALPADWRGFVAKMEWPVGANWTTCSQLWGKHLAKNDECNAGMLSMQIQQDGDNLLFADTTSELHEAATADHPDVYRFYLWLGRNLSDGTVDPNCPLFYEAGDVTVDTSGDAPDWDRFSLTLNVASPSSVSASATNNFVLSDLSITVDATGCPTIFTDFVGNLYRIFTFSGAS